MRFRTLPLYLSDRYYPRFINCARINRLSLHLIIVLHAGDTVLYLKTTAFTLYYSPKYLAKNEDKICFQRYTAE